MKIVDVRIEESILPKKDKDWKFALAANPATEGWIVAIRAEDGTTGYGYASTMNHYGAPHEAGPVLCCGVSTPAAARSCA